jgi:hypothetical protein
MNSGLLEKFAGTSSHCSFKGFMLHSALDLLQLELNSFFWWDPAAKASSR